jgi:hypothetical protein
MNHARNKKEKKKSTRKKKEEEVVGCMHTQLSALMLKTQQFPEDVIAFYHLPIDIILYLQHLSS